MDSDSNNARKPTPPKGKQGRKKESFSLVNVPQHLKEYVDNELSPDFYEAFDYFNDTCKRDYKGYQGMIDILLDHGDAVTKAFDNYYRQNEQQQSDINSKSTRVQQLEKELHDKNQIIEEQTKRIRDYEHQLDELSPLQRQLFELQVRYDELTKLNNNLISSFDQRINQLIDARLTNGTEPTNATNTTNTTNVPLSRSRTAATRGRG